MRKYFVKPVSNKKLVKEYIKYVYNSIMKTRNSTKKRAKDLNRHFIRKMFKWPIIQQCSSSLDEHQINCREMQIKTDNIHQNV